jgi:hypothetical protein
MNLLEIISVDLDIIDQILIKAEWILEVAVQRVDES